MLYKQLKSSTKRELLKMAAKRQIKRVCRLNKNDLIQKIIDYEKSPLSEKELALNGMGIFKLRKIAASLKIARCNYYKKAILIKEIMKYNEIPEIKEKSKYSPLKVLELRKAAKTLKIKGYYRMKKNILLQHIPTEILDEYMERYHPNIEKANIKDLVTLIEDRKKDFSAREINKIKKRLLNLSEGKKILINYDLITYNGNEELSRMKQGIVLNEANINRIINEISTEYTEVEKYGSDISTKYLYGLKRNFRVYEINNNKPKEILDQDGGFFGYINLSKFDLSRFQIFNREQYKENEKQIEHCLVHTLKISGVESAIINQLEITAHVRRRDLKQIALKINRPIRLSVINPNQKRINNSIYNRQSKNETINIALYKNHYFVNYWDNDQINTIAAKHWKDPNIRSDLYMYSSTGNHYGFGKAKPLRIIYELDKHGAFEYAAPLNKNMYFEGDEDKFDFSVVDAKPVKVAGVRKYKKNILYVFADIESTTDGKKHKAYMLSYKIYQAGSGIKTPTMSYYDSELEGNVVKQFIDQMISLKRSNTDIIIYFHNMKYDIQFLWDYINVRKSVKKGGNYYSITIDKGIEIRDSLKIITAPLKNFGVMFGLEQPKEIFPYDAYTQETCGRKRMMVRTALKYIKENDRDHFLNNLEELNLYTSETKNYFNHIEYSRFYCDRDVEVLMEGMLKFREDMLEITDMDIFKSLTISSFVHRYMVKNRAYKNVYQIGGDFRYFIQKCVVGGQVMSMDNKKYSLNKRISDFDAVSLYPSAIYLGPGIPMGIPTGFNKYELGDFKRADRKNKLKILHYYTHSYLKIKITRIGKKLPMPLIYKRTNSSIDYVNELTEMYCDILYLEDLIEFQDIDFEILEGVYFNNGYNTKIKEILKTLFDLRLKYKKEGNNLQLNIKLMLNSIYGKTIMKSVKNYPVYVKDENFELFVTKNYNRILSFTKIGERYYEVKLIKSIRDHYNIAQFGVIVLSYSKRIMNQIKCLGYDNDIPTYYQDTDSMHLETDKIKKLSDLYREKYNRELIGKAMGQFHSDFDAPGSVGELVAVKTIILGKKSYYDLLEDEAGNHFDHIRLKGITKESIHAKCSELNTDTLGLYQKMYEGKTMKFNLVQPFNPKFEFVNGIIRNRRDFIRSIKF